MNKLIITAVGYIKDYHSNPDMTKAVQSEKGYEIYLKNAFTCLLSIKKKNEDSDVALVTNIDLDATWSGLFRDNNIVILHLEYSSFLMPSHTPYSLAYYKICALRYCVMELDYDYICIIDCDCYGINNFKEVWEEAKDAILIIPSEFSINTPWRSETISIYNALYPQGSFKNIVHYSSGFIAGSKHKLNEYIKFCEKAYRDLINYPDIVPTVGDEIIWSLAAAFYEAKIYSAKPYVLLSNIGFSEYYVDKKDYHDPSIILWHLPTEKRYALAWAFDYFIRRNRLPSVNKVAKASRIRRIYNHFNILSLFVILRSKGTVKRNLKKIF